jgi:succinate-semialdehyde dehydrogenase / glutarate-semialdehyde dehydrogenase
VSKFKMQANRMKLESSPLIDGRALPRAGRDVLPVRNPADETVIGSVVCASTEDVGYALEVAEAARRSWRTCSPSERGAILIRAASLMRVRIKKYAALLTLEQGKTLAESLAEWERAIETFEWHGKEAERLNDPETIKTSSGDRTVMPEPMGVVAAFTPWNYPVVIIARKVAAALVAGCPIILKAAEETPNSAAVVVSTLFEAGLPCNALQLLFGKPPAISPILLASPSVRVMSFTGSTSVGKHLARLAADRLIRTVLELGGHSPVVISADADIEQAASAIGAYKYECAGQSCNAPSRIYVERPVYVPFVTAFVELSESLKVGGGLESQVDMGPMANSRRIEAMEVLVSDARAHGGRVACGGARQPRPGYFFPPTVLLDVAEGAKIFVDEPFGPVLPIVPVDSIEEGIVRADANPYGLASYVFAANTALALDIASRLDAGSVGVNQLKGVAPEAPLSGVKDSGYGYEGGKAGVEAFQNRKLISGAKFE